MLGSPRNQEELDAVRFLPASSPVACSSLWSFCAVNVCESHFDLVLSLRSPFLLPHLRSEKDRDPGERRYQDGGARSNVQSAFVKAILSSPFLYFVFLLPFALSVSHTLPLPLSSSCAFPGLSCPRVCFPLLLFFKVSTVSVCLPSFFSFRTPFASPFVGETKAVASAAHAGATKNDSKCMDPSRSPRLPLFPR
ncbi:putative transmembrane protein [Toxoplasma gondii MAS]|uniref:Putative transmembrane protein n=1 Tax=Toxoplasma gondii MAS TaxID=943118 RepID=A0A086QYB4_TOXGO|nr:putative transmembrane protein [Toxoplasma gondii MAS]